MGGILLSLPNNNFYGIFLSILSIVPFLISFQVLKFGYDSRNLIKSKTAFSKIKKTP